MLLAEAIGNLVGLGDTSNVGVGLLNDFAVLDIEATNGTKSTGCSAVGSYKLSHNCHLLSAVDRLARSEEVLGPPSVGVEITTILVAVAIVARLASTTGGVASAGAVSGARVRSKSGGDGVLQRWSVNCGNLGMARFSLTASQISISAQHEPVFPVPELGSPFEGVHPSTFACIKGQCQNSEQLVDIFSPCRQ